MKPITAAMTLLALGCSLSSESEGPPPLISGLPRTLTAAESQLVSGANGFGLALFLQARAQAPDDNLFLSPTSAAMALGMTMNGAAGLTLDSMRVALQVDQLPLPEIDAGYRSLIDLLRGLDGSTDFRIANSIWAQNGISWRAGFLDAARTSFDAEVRSLDLQAPASLEAINTWVKEKTGGKIPTILDNVQSNEVMFLINAVYFKGKWRSAFDPDRTSPGPFHAATGGVQTVQMMHREPDTLRYASLADVDVVDLLYGNGAWSMTIVLPHEGGSLSQATTGLGPAKWNEWITALAPGQDRARDAQAPPRDQARAQGRPGCARHAPGVRRRAGRLERDGRGTDDRQSLSHPGDPEDLRGYQRGRDRSGRGHIGRRWRDVSSRDVDDRPAVPAGDPGAFLRNDSLSGSDHPDSLRVFPGQVVACTAAAASLVATTRFRPSALAWNNRASAM